MTNLSAPIVEKVYLSDFDRVYKILKNFQTPSLSKDEWSKLFFRPWDTQEDHYGYMLTHNDEVVGFIGTIFSIRNINNRFHKFCNVTSWIVNPEFRRYSVSLLIPILRLKEYTVTNFTASATVRDLLVRAGFQELDSHWRVISPISLLVRPISHIKLQVLWDKSSIDKQLEGVSHQVFRHHQEFKCHHLLATAASDCCYLIITKLKKKDTPVAYVHYISDLSIFVGHVYHIISSILIHLKSAAVIIDERFLKGRSIPFSIKYRFNQGKLFKSHSCDRNQIDNLYSELVTLCI